MMPTCMRCVRVCSTSRSRNQHPISLSAPHIHLSSLPASSFPSSLLAMSSPDVFSTLWWYVLTIYQVFLEPLLCHLRLVTPGFGDPTYGRASLPPGPKERMLIHDEPRMINCRRRVMMKGEAMRRGGSWDREGTQWVSYQVWEWKGAEEKVNCEYGACGIAARHSRGIRNEEAMVVLLGVAFRAGNEVAGSAGSRSFQRAPECMGRLGDIAWV